MASLTDIVLVLATLTVIVPLSSLAMASFLGHGEYIIPPKTITLENYIELMDEGFYINIANTFITISISVLIALLLATPTSYAIAKSEFTQSLWAAVVVMLLVAKSIPPASLLIPLYQWLWSIGLTNSYLGLALAYQAYILPFTIWVLTAFFLDIPSELDLAARIDGAGPVDRFIRIALPLAIPGITSAIILDYLVLWNEYMYASVLISDSSLYTASVIIGHMISSEYGLEWGILAAANILTIIPMLFFIGTVQKNISKAFTGGIKR